MTTDFSNQVKILGDFYALYREEPNAKEFIEFNDLGLPLSYLSSVGLCQILEDGVPFVSESWEMFLSSLGIKTDEGFDSLDHVMMKAEIGKWPGDTV